MPLDSKLVRTADFDIVLFTVSKDEKKITDLTRRGVRVEVLPAEAGRVPLGAVLDMLGSEGILTLLTETGTRLNTALLAGGLVDRVHIFVSPQIMGSDAVPAFKGLTSPINMGAVEVERYDNDLGLCSLLRDPWTPRKRENHANVASRRGTALLSSKHPHPFYANCPEDRRNSASVRPRGGSSDPSLRIPLR